MTEKIVLTLTKHPLWGHILQPVLVEENDYGTLSILEYADSRSSGFTQLNELSKEIVRLSENMSDMALMTKFSKEKVKTIAVFHRKVKPELIEQTIRPYIEDIHRQILLLLNNSQLPFYIRENVKIRNLYESDLAIIPDNSSKAIFHFTKEEDSCIHYSIRVKWQEEELDLFSQPFLQLCSEPAALVINKRLLSFENVEIKKLIPFFTKREIEIPLSYESTYIKTYIKSCLENHEVVSQGFDIQEIVPSKKARLLIESDSENMPVLNLTFIYEDNEYALNSIPQKIVQPVEDDGKTTLTWFSPDKEWEKSLICMLSDNGFEKTESNHFTLKKNKAEFLVVKQIKNLNNWISQNSKIMNHFEFNQELSS